MLLTACFLDLKTGKISNVLVFCLVLWGMGWRLSREGLAGLGEYVLCSLIWIGISYPLYKLGMLGAGDVKLLGFLEGFFSFSNGFTYFLCMMVVGGILALCKMLYSRNVRERLWYFASYIKDVICTGSWHLYFENEKSRQEAGAHIPMSLPMLIGFLVYQYI